MNAFMQRVFLSAAEFLILPLAFHLRNQNPKILRYLAQEPPDWFLLQIVLRISPGFRNGNHIQGVFPFDDFYFSYCILSLRDAFLYRVRGSATKENLEEFTFPKKSET